MAQILHADGTAEDCSPADGRLFSLGELQAIVGGYIEILSTRDGRKMVVNEQGKRLQLPRNEAATALVELLTPAAITKALLAHPNVVFVGDPEMLKQEGADYVAGDVLVLTQQEMD